MIGKSGSYATVAPIQNYLGQALSNIEDNSFKYRQEKRLAEETEKAEKEKQQAQADKDFLEGKRVTDVTPTGYDMFDVSLQKYSSDMFNLYGDKKAQLRTEKDQNKRNLLLSDINNIEKNIALVNNNVALLKEKEDFLLKNYDKLDPDSRDAMAKKINALQQGHYVFEVGDRGKSDVILYDKEKLDENGKPTVISKEPLSDVVRNTKAYMKSNFQDILSKYVKNTGFQETKQADGSYIIEKKDATPEAKKQKSESYANELISDENEMDALSKRAKLPKNDIEGLKKYAEQEYLNSLPKKEFKEKNYEELKYQLAQQREARERQKDAREAQEKEKKTVTYYTETGKFENNGVVDGVKMPKGTLSITPKNAEIERTKTIKDFVKEVYLSPQGDLFLRIENINEGSQGETIKEDIYERTASGARKLVNGTPVILKTINKRSNSKKSSKIINVDNNISDANEYLDVMGETVESLKNKVKTMSQGKISKNEVAKYNAEIAAKNAKARAETQAKNKQSKAKQKVDEYGVPIN